MSARKSASVCIILAVLLVNLNVISGSPLFGGTYRAIDESFLPPHPLSLGLEYVHDEGRAVATRITKNRTLAVLDGLEDITLFQFKESGAPAVPYHMGKDYAHQSIGPYYCPHQLIVMGEARSCVPLAIRVGLPLKPTTFDYQVGVDLQVKRYLYNSRMVGNQVLSYDREVDINHLADYERLPGPKSLLRHGFNEDGSIRYVPNPTITKSQGLLTLLPLSIQDDWVEFGVIDRVVGCRSFSGQLRLQPSRYGLQHVTEVQIPLGMSYSFPIYMKNPHLDRELGVHGVESIGEIFHVIPGEGQWVIPPSQASQHILSVYVVPSQVGFYSGQIVMDTSEGIMAVGVTVEVVAAQVVASKKVVQLDSLNHKSETIELVNSGEDTVHIQSVILDESLAPFSIRQLALDVPPKSVRRVAKVTIANKRSGEFQSAVSFRGTMGEEEVTLNVPLSGRVSKGSIRLEPDQLLLQSAGGPVSTYCFTMVNEIDSPVEVSHVYSYDPRVTITSETLEKVRRSDMAPSGSEMDQVCMEFDVRYVGDSSAKSTLLQIETNLGTFPVNLPILSGSVSAVWHGPGVDGMAMEGLNLGVMNHGMDIMGEIGLENELYTAQTVTGVQITFAYEGETLLTSSLGPNVTFPIQLEDTVRIPLRISMSPGAATVQNVDVKGVCTITLAVGKTVKHSVSLRLERGILYTLPGVVKIPVTRAHTFNLTGLKVEERGGQKAIPLSVSSGFTGLFGIKEMQMEGYGIVDFESVAEVEKDALTVDGEGYVTLGYFHVKAENYQQWIDLGGVVHSPMGVLYAMDEIFMRGKAPADVDLHLHAIPMLHIVTTESISLSVPVFVEEPAAMASRGFPSEVSCGVVPVGTAVECDVLSSLGGSAARYLMDRKDWPISMETMEAYLKQSNPDALFVPFARDDKESLVGFGAESTVGPILFRPDHVGEVYSFVPVEGAGGEVYFIRLQGKGGEGKLVGLEASVVLELDSNFYSQCKPGEVPEEMVHEETLQLRNGGDVAVPITTLGFGKDRACQVGVFQVSPCIGEDAGYLLAPGSTLAISIRFTPSFTEEDSVQSLYIETEGGNDINRVKVVGHVDRKKMGVCHAYLHHHAPLWDISTVLMAFSVAIALVLVAVLVTKYYGSLVKPSTRADRMDKPISMTVDVAEPEEDEEDTITPPSPVVQGHTKRNSLTLSITARDGTESIVIVSSPSDPAPPGRTFDEDDASSEEEEPEVATDEEGEEQRAYEDSLLDDLEKLAQDPTPPAEEATPEEPKEEEPEPVLPIVRPVVVPQFKGKKKEVEVEKDDSMEQLMMAATTLKRSPDRFTGDRSESPRNDKANGSWSNHPDPYKARGRHNLTGSKPTNKKWNNDWDRREKTYGNYEQRWKASSANKQRSFVRNPRMSEREPERYAPSGEAIPMMAGGMESQMRGGEVSKAPPGLTKKPTMQPAKPVYEVKAHEKPQVEVPREVIRNTQGAVSYPHQSTFQCSTQSGLPSSKPLRNARTSWRYKGVAGEEKTASWGGKVEPAKPRPDRSYVREDGMATALFERDQSRALQDNMRKFANLDDLSSEYPATGISNLRTSQDEQLTPRNKSASAGIIGAETTRQSTWNGNHARGQQEDSSADGVWTFDPLDSWKLPSGKKDDRYGYF